MTYIYALFSGYDTDGNCKNYGNIAGAGVQNGKKDTETASGKGGERGEGLNFGGNIQILGNVSIVEKIDFTEEELSAINEICRE